MTSAKTTFGSLAPAPIATKRSALSLALRTSLTRFWTNSPSTEKLLLERKKRKRQPQPKKKPRNKKNCAQTAPGIASNKFIIVVSDHCLVLKEEGLGGRE